MFKDLLGKEIRAGDHIIYIQSWADKNIEEAIVTKCEEEFIRVEYLGKGSPPKYQWNHKKPLGKQSRFTSTDKKIIIMTSETMSLGDRNIFDEVRKDLEKDILKLKTKLMKSSAKEASLLKKIELLQAEVDKIHSRWNILDL